MSYPKKRSAPDEPLLFAIPNNSVEQTLSSCPSAQKDFDPELLYVECQGCGKPVLWDKGKTTLLLQEAAIDPRHLDERCLILADSCPLCSPEGQYSYVLTVVRMAGLTPEEAVHMMRPAGTA